MVSTAGNVAFVGDFDRVFRAVDVKTGKTLWKTRLGTTVQGYPVTFSVDGKQYIAVTTGLGGGSPEAEAQHHAERSSPAAERLCPVRVRPAGRQVAIKPVLRQGRRVQRRP